MSKESVTIKFGLSGEAKNAILAADKKPSAELLKISYNKHQLKGLLTFEENELSEQIILEAINALNAYLNCQADNTESIVEVC